MSLYEILVDKSFQTSKSQILKIANSETTEERSIQVQKQTLFFNNTQCEVLTLKDVSYILKLLKLSTQLGLVKLMTASVTHELVTPLKCIIQFGESVMSQCKKDRKLYEQCKLIVDTAFLLLAQVKCFLDKNILETTDSITPNLSMCSLKNTLKLGVRILKS